MKRFCPRLICFILTCAALLLCGCESTAPRHATPRPPNLVESSVRFTASQLRSDGHRIVLIEATDPQRVERILVHDIHFHEWSNQRVSADIDAEVWVNDNGVTRHERRELIVFATAVDRVPTAGQLLISLHVLPDANFEIRFRGPVSVAEPFKKRLNMLKLWELKGPVDFTAEGKNAPVKP